MQKNWIKRVAGLLVGLCLLIGIWPTEARAASAQVDEAAVGIIRWVRELNGSGEGGALLQGEFLEQAGSGDYDWFAFTFARIGVDDNYDAYLEALEGYVTEKYTQDNKLDRTKATEWHRISLTVLALGGDPTAFGQGSDGKSIDLIADGTYNWKQTASLGRQGLNGYLYGLLALDALDYNVPAGATYTRESLLEEILSRQLEDGGFALAGKTMDPDVTGIALQALAPYAHDDNPVGESGKSTRQAIKAALAALSRQQNEDGGYSTMGTPTSESAAQVVVALCSLGIDPTADPRFLKNGRSPVDALLDYRQADGGFAHLSAGKSDFKASVQALYALAAVKRLQNGQRRLFDLRPEWTEQQQQLLEKAGQTLAALPERPTKAQVEAAEVAYAAVPESERSYVAGYDRLEAARAAVDVPIGTTAGSSATANSTTAESTTAAEPTASESDGQTMASQPGTAHSTQTGGEAGTASPTASSTQAVGAGLPGAQDGSSTGKESFPRWLLAVLVGGGVFLLGGTALTIRWWLGRRKKAPTPEEEIPEKGQARRLQMALLLLGGVSVVAALLVLFVNIQSVDEYYLTHLDDITPESETVTLSICCQTVLDNWDDLDPALKEGNYLPEDGVILPATKYVLRPGDTVFDILERAVRYNRIQMEYQGSNQNALGTVYIQGIGYLYELSCGPLSGWMYRVNGEFPGQGCDRYALQDGDVIEWVYTCNLGYDVGGGPSDFQGQQDAGETGSLTS